MTPPRRSGPVILLLLVIAVGIGGCGFGDAGATPTRSLPTPVPASASDSPPGAVDSAEPATDDPGLEPSVEPTDEPTVGPSESATASGPAASAAACTGTDKNRVFFASIAAGVDWDVYCAVLPARWLVDAGSYRLPAGGKMDIAYKGPGGRRLQLREGAFCTDPGGCVPDGTDGGEAMFGDRAGVLVHAADGSIAVVVDRGSKVSWLAIATGVSETDLRDYLAAMVKVAP